MSVTTRPTSPSATTPATPAWPRSLATLVRRGLRDNRRAPLTWGGGLGLMSALMAAIWPSIEDSMETLMESYPSGLKEAFGIDELNTVEQYIDAEMLSLIVPLAMAFFAVRCATRATVGAEERGYLDTLLSLPVSRRVLVWSAAIVTAVMSAVILGVVFALTWVTGVVVGTGISEGILADGLINVWPLTMLFGGIAIFMAGVVGRPATVTAVGVGGAVAMYVINLIGKLASEVEPLRVVSAFRYYGSAVQDGLDASHVVGLTFVALVLAAVGAELFERRDLN